MAQSDCSILSEVFLFNGMEISEVAALTRSCPRIQYSAGDLIHSSKKQSHGIGVILSGRARIVSGGGDTLLRILRTGDVFGAASVFAIDDGNRTAVIASGKCTVLLIPEDKIREILSAYPDAALRYIGFLSDRIDFLNTRISSLAAGDAVAKVAGYILSLDHDDQGVAYIKDSLTNIASRLNMGRASLYRTIDRFVADGYISRDKDMLTILDRDSLEDIIFKKRSR